MSKRMRVGAFESNPSMHINLILIIVSKRPLSPHAHWAKKNCKNWPYSGETMAKFLENCCRKLQPLKLIKLAKLRCIREGLNFFWVPTHIE